MYSENIDIDENGQVCGALTCCYQNHERLLRSCDKRREVNWQKTWLVFALFRSRSGVRGGRKIADKHSGPSLSQGVPHQQFFTLPPGSSRL